MQCNLIIMILIIKLFGIVFILLGISFLLESEGVYSWVENKSGHIGFYLSVIVGRVTMGILLLLAAKESKYPSVIKFIGILAIIAAIILIILGPKGFQNLMSSLIPIFKPYAPVSGLTGIAIGGFLIYAFSRK